MTGFLQRLQRRKGAGRGLQAEDIVLRGTSVATGIAKGATKKRGKTSSLLTNREPSPDGFLGELIGLRAEKQKGDGRTVLDQDRQGVNEGNIPPWLNNPPRQLPQLDILVPAARMVLYELFNGENQYADVLSAINRAVSTAAHRLSGDTHFTTRDTQAAVQELHGLIAGKGPIQVLYDDPFVTDIYIDSHDRIRCLRFGQALETPFRFRSQVEYEAFFTTMLESVGMALGVKTPIVDCVLKDEWRSRVNAVHGSLRENGESSLVIRVPRLRHATLYDLLRSQTLPAPLAGWLSELMSFGEANFLIMGPAGSGKTTLAAALLSSVGTDERVCTIEEIPEIFVANCQLEKLVTRPPDVFGAGAIDVEKILNAALHRAPHRIVMGEIRDREGHLFLRALETGHSGSIATMHADNPIEGLWRLFDIVMTHEQAPVDVVQRRISRLVHLVIILHRVNGRPCVEEVCELLPAAGGELRVQPLVKYIGTMRGKRVWRKVVTTSRLLDMLSERGVELMTNPTLLPPDEVHSNDMQSEE